ncbi:hypothetical protein [Sulfitobacter geojensis]|uniref:hypothetical protein n=1 Tax=Sulfitobacter geojensis TaxID=1342299 RepID=UPI00249388CB|nr:hypothetical protein [Sulfitobacter geojensis]
MIQFLKELADAAEARIRSPFIGSIALVFFTLNWKAVAILLFASGSIELRVLTFDEMTTLQSLIFYPVLLGVMIALILPWSKLLGAWIAKKPAGILRRLQHDESQQFRIYQLNGNAAEAEAQARMDEATERARIDAAKRLEEAREVSPKLEEEIIEERHEAEHGLDTIDKDELWEIEILDMAASSRNGQLIISNRGVEVSTDPERNLTDWSNLHKDRAVLQKLIQSMSDRGLIDFVTSSQEDGSDVYEITASGYIELDANKS